MMISYLVNRSPTTAIKLKTPEEYGMVNLLTTLDIRYLGYAHQSEGKLEPRYVKCAFLGYTNGVKGYRVCQKGSNGFKIIISKDVLFNELNMPCLSENDQETGITSKRKNIQIEMVTPLYPKLSKTTQSK